MGGPSEIFVRFLRLGSTSFGGPVAHIAFFRSEFVERARWLDDTAFTEIVALCSVLPGPTSSQVGIVLGLRRDGWRGAFLAWLGFTLPSALFLGALGIAFHGAHAGTRPHAALVDGIARGLGAAAAAVVLLAVVQLARALVRTRVALAIALVALGLGLAIDRVAPTLQWLPLVLGGMVGGAFGRPVVLPPAAPLGHVGRRTALAAAALFAFALVGLPFVAAPGTALALFSQFFRAGALVFGGGHVVLPFLQSAIGSLVGERDFFAGYGAAQAVPGPLFTFAAFLGGANAWSASGPLGAAVAIAGIFAPSFLAIAAVVPLWSRLRDLPRAGAVLAGLGASVVGLLAAVFCDPIARKLIDDPASAVVAVAAFLVLWRTKTPTWLVVALCAGSGALRA